MTVVCEYTGCGTLKQSVRGRGVDTGGANFFCQIIKLTNQKQPKVTCLIRH